MTARLRSALALALALTGLAPAEGRAGEDDRRRGGQVVARQPRPHRLLHEVDLTAGILPLDALYTGLSLGGSYTLHLSDVFALELVDFHYSANVDSGLRARLAERYGSNPTVTPEIEYVAGTGVLFTPYFGKLALFDRGILTTAAHLGANFGVAHFTDGFRFQISGGPGLRFFLSDEVSTRLDARVTLAFDDQLGVETLLQLNLGLAFNLGGGRPTPPRTTTTPDVDPDATLDELFPGTAPKPRAEPDPGKESGE